MNYTYMANIAGHKIKIDVSYNGSLYENNGKCPLCNTPFISRSNSERKAKVRIDNSARNHIKRKHPE